MINFECYYLDSKIKLSEDDVVPQMRQRSNTLPKSFGSQLEREEERKPEVEKAAKPSIEATMDVIHKKLQEKRVEVNRPEDMKVKSVYVLYIQSVRFLQDESLDAFFLL